MFKRIIWIAAGFGAGLSSSLWMKRVVKKRATEYSASVAANFLENSVKATKSTISGVAGEGKRIAGNTKTGFLTVREEFPKRHSDPKRLINKSGRKAQ
ncbi:MAG: hypothetical protein CM15mP49_09380 [Actinomycetota bacterium]|nr:MAG: hypothetical protein CM15mP49_09380 [Actinomycetota bacterium]